MEEPVINRNHQLPAGQYFTTKHKKTQLFIHFTAGGPQAENVMAGWASNDERIGCSYVIDRDGEILQAFDPDYWAFHLGIKGTNGKLDKISVGIEICAWGPLTKKGDKYYNYLNREVPSDEVYELESPHRGYKYYHAYSEAQIKALESLIPYISNKYNIPTNNSTFDDDWFEFNVDIIKNSTPGIWTHTTVRKDKFDSYPDERLKNILKNLS